MKVLLIPDSYGWAFDFYALGLKRFSKHDITVLPVSPTGTITSELIDDHDVIFCFSRWIWDNLPYGIRRKACKKPFIMWCCGSYFKDPPLEIDRFALCTERLMKKAENAGMTKTVLLREGVDTINYAPFDKTPSEELRVGWAGNASRPIKRAHLLKQLKYPVKVKSDHDMPTRIQNREPTQMVQFYNSLDVYITLMAQNGAHGVGRTILEAMSCGLPVIATNIISASKAVPEEWLIPSEPDDVAVKAMNEKLHLLDENRDLISKVGASNRKFILENYSWKIISEDWDRLFEEVAALY